MSTTVYNALRCKPKHLVGVLAELREQMLRIVGPVVEAAMAEATGLRPQDRFRHVIAEAAANAAKPFCWDSDFQCGVKVYTNGTYFYCIPWFSARGRADRLTCPANSVPYEYWNNTDGPDDVPRREWRARGKVWHALLDTPRLDYCVVDLREPGATYSEYDLKQQVKHLFDSLPEVGPRDPQG